KLVVNKGLEEFERHTFGQTALMEFQVGAGNDDGTSGVVNALSEQVLTETALLALDHVGERLEGAFVGAGDGFSAAAVVEQGVDGFLKHTLLVADDDCRSVQLEQTLEAVVAVDHATVEIVEIGGRETAAVQGNERAQIRRQNRDNVEDEPFR